MTTLAEYCNAAAEGEAPRRLALTFDVDWAPEHVLEALVAYLRERGVRATVFATHPSPILVESEAAGTIEIGLHPNFGAGSSHGANPEAVIARLRSWFPDAAGVRTHGLLQSSNLLRMMSRADLAYDSSLQLFDLPFVQPVATFFGMIRLPYIWSDAAHLLEGRPFTTHGLGLGGPGLKVLGFHPMLWFLNAHDGAPYEAAKRIDPDLTRVSATALEALVQEGPGIRALLDEILDTAVAEGWCTFLLREVAETAAAWYRDGGRPLTFGWSHGDEDPSAKAAP